MKYLIIVIALILGGCAAWANFVHEQAQEEYRKDIVDDGVILTKEGECLTLDKKKVPCSEIDPNIPDDKVYLQTK